MFQDKVAVVTGGAQGIGRCICEEFTKQGARVCTIDLLENDFFQGDVGKKEDLERFAQKVIQTYGRVDFLVNNAKQMCIRDRQDGGCRCPESDSRSTGAAEWISRRRSAR